MCLDESRTAKRQVMARQVTVRCSGIEQTRCELMLLVSNVWGAVAKVAKVWGCGWQRIGSLPALV